MSSVRSFGIENAPKMRSFMTIDRLFNFVKSRTKRKAAI